MMPRRRCLSPWGAVLLSLVACSRERREERIVAPSVLSGPLATSPRATAGETGAVEASAVGTGGVGTGVEIARPRPAIRGVLLISIDSLRADMPWNGYARPIAPRLTKFAEGAVNYTNAYSVSSYTSMSVGGLLAGTLPSELKRDGFFFGGYAKENLFFPELLQKEGIRTIGVQAHSYFKTAGFDQGFDDWKLVPNISFNNLTDENVTSEQQEALAEASLRNVGENRFFAWFHFMDPHDKYLPHPGIAYGNKARDLYDAEVTFTDRAVGKLLDFVEAQPWGKETAIVVTADHGEAFGEHGRFFHGFELWEEVVRVPLLVRVPGVKPQTIHFPRGAIDLAPTILDLFGVSKNEGMRGLSLLSEIEGKPGVEREVVLDLPMTSDNDLRRAVIFGGKKVIRMGASGSRVYRLSEDPGETKPIQGDDREEMLARLKKVDDQVRFQPTTICKEACLNGAYAKGGDAGQAGK